MKSLFDGFEDQPRYDGGKERYQHANPNHCGDGNFLVIMRDEGRDDCESDDYLSNFDGGLIHACFDLR